MPTTLAPTWTSTWTGVRPTVTEPALTAESVLKVCRCEAAGLVNQTRWDRKYSDVPLRNSGLAKSALMEKRLSWSAGGSFFVRTQK